MTDDRIYGILKSYKAISKKDNIYHAEKAFRANSAIKWCVKKREDGSFSSTHLETYFLFIHKYLKGEAELVWDEDFLSIEVDDYCNTV